MAIVNEDLRIQLEWEDPGAARGEELRATWCRLSIQVGASRVTRVLDERAQTVRNAVYCSAYPLAEWFAYNWWPLISEAKRPTVGTYGERHNVRFAREGFALPDLEFFPEGSLVRAAWKPFKPAAAPVRFLELGEALIDKGQFISEIQAFLRTVCARLDAERISGAPLISEWQEILAAQDRNEELAFCQTSGALGLDPYDMPEDRAAELLEVEKRLPGELRHEFFLAAEPEGLLRQAQWVEGCLVRLRGHEVRTVVAGRRGAYRGTGLFRGGAAWASGYELACQFRKEFDLGTEDRPLDWEALLEAGSGRWPVISVGEQRSLDGVALLDAACGPQLATAKRRRDSQKYALARTLCEYLCAEGEESALLTPVSSDQQRRNRAFAAELLAPSRGIQARLSTPGVTLDEIAEIAGYFEVSEWVVRHQVENHRLATIEGVD